MKKSPKNTEHEFNELLLISIDEALTSLGESAKTAIYSNIAQKFKIQKQEIPNRLDDFVEAIDAMPNGGKLTITSKESGNNVEISFKDSGMGMSKETLSKLWTPLFTTKAKGMGFGLAICKRIIEAHRGKICVESITGKGTTFIVSVPVDPQPATEAEENWVFNASIEAAAT